MSDLDDDVWLDGQDLRRWAIKLLYEHGWPRDHIAKVIDRKVGYVDRVLKREDDASRYWESQTLPGDLNDLQWSVRTFNAVKSFGVQSQNELRDRMNEFKKIKGVGKKTIAEVEELLPTPPLSTPPTD